jgi:hypothetical protein
MKEPSDAYHAPSIGRVAVLSRNDRGDRDKAAGDNRKILHAVYEALAALGVAAEPAVYSDEMADGVREHLLQMDGVLVWVDPISDGRDRLRLDAMLREVASNGVWISAHPDVILKMGTKEVLYRTRDLGWGTDTHLYNSAEEFHQYFPPRLASAGPRVLKQNRGNGGIGVWKVELPASISVRPNSDTVVRVQHARTDSPAEQVLLGAFMNQCAEYLSGAGRIVDQAFQPRVAEGMVRCYLSENRVVGFSQHLPRGLLPPPCVENGVSTAGRGAEGLTFQKTMYGPSAPAFQRLRTVMESEWIPAMQRLLGIETACLPAIWDADFLYGPKTPSAEDTFVLCEINASCIFPFPPDAPTELARSVRAHLLGDS